jgi:outer membrane lipoprotein SlyB
MFCKNLFLSRQSKNIVVCLQEEAMKIIRQSGKIHPLVAAAAASVIIVSLVGTAAITGLLPNSDSATKPADAVAVMPAAPEKPAAPVRQHSKPVSTLPKEASNKPVEVAAATPVCNNCGKVTDIRTVEQAAKPSGVGVVAGAVLGGVLGNQVGGGTGKTLATVAGAAAGGYAGNEVEKRTRKTTAYEVNVRMEDGSSRAFPFETLPEWKTGDRVKVLDGALVRR